MCEWRLSKYEYMSGHCTGMVKSYHKLWICYRKIMYVYNVFETEDEKATATASASFGMPFYAYTYGVTDKKKNGKGFYS